MRIITEMVITVAVKAESADKRLGNSVDTSDPVGASVFRTCCPCLESVHEDLFFIRSLDRKLCGYGTDMFIVDGEDQFKGTGKGLGILKNCTFLCCKRIIKLHWQPLSSLSALLQIPQLFHQSG